MLRLDSIKRSVCYGCALLAGLLATAAVRAGTSVGPFTMQDLGGLPPSVTTAALGINDSGQIVGTVSSNGGEAVIFSGYSTTYLGDVGGTNSNGNLSEGRGINSIGQVVGNSEVPSGTQHAFLYSAGTIQDLGTLGGASSLARSINDAGQVVGYSATAGGGQQAFLYAGGRMNPLSAGGGYTLFEATSINNAGQIAGSLTEAGSNNVYAYIDDAGQVTPLSTFGGALSEANAINASGAVVGASDTPSGDQHAFLYAAGTLTDLGSLGGASSVAEGLNDSGAIVGASLAPGVGYHAFLYENGTMYDLNNLVSNLQGYDLEAANAINAEGQIVVDAAAPDGTYRAVLLTPTAVPLPPALWESIGLLPLLLLAKRFVRKPIA